MSSIYPISALLSYRDHRKMFRRIDADTLEWCVDNSTMEKLLTCPRSFEFYDVFGRDTGERDALNYGTAIHRACEAYFEGHDLLQIIKVLHEHFMASPCSENSWRNLDHAIEAMTRYVRLREQLPAWRPLNVAKYTSGHRLFANGHVKPVAVEIPFKIKLMEVTIDKDIPYPESLLCDSGDEEQKDPVVLCRRVVVYYTGKIDMMVECNSTIDPLDYDIVDHKTTSIGGPTFWKSFRLSAQMRGYTWAATQLMDRAPRSTIIDAIVGRAPTVKGKGTPHELEQQAFTYREEQIDEWKRSLESHIHMMFTRLQEGFFPEANTHCQNKYGSCDYFDVCSQANNVRHILLASGQFADRKWSPLA